MEIEANKNSKERRRERATVTGHRGGVGWGWDQKCAPNRSIFFMSEGAHPPQTPSKREKYNTVLKDKKGNEHEQVGLHSFLLIKNTNQTALFLWGN